MAPHPEFQSVAGPHRDGAAISVCVNWHCLRKHTYALSLLKTFPGHWNITMAGHIEHAL